MTEDIPMLLARIPEPAPPASLSATVMARIEREHENQSRVSEPVASRRSHRVRFTWLSAVAGLALVLWVTGAGLTMDSLSGVMSPRIGSNSVSLMPMQGPAGIVIGIGLLIYLAGLFAPMRRQQINRDSAS